VGLGVLKCGNQAAEARHETKMTARYHHVSEQPKETLECKTHEILKARMRADLRVYRDGVNTLEDLAIGAMPKDFEKAHKLAEIARIAYIAARDRFNAHVTSHRCEIRYIRYGAVQRPRSANRQGS
jgi:putative SOS response-associated peptidase YedK